MEKRETKSEFRIQADALCVPATNWQEKDQKNRTTLQIIANEDDIMCQIHGNRERLVPIIASIMAKNEVFMTLVEEAVRLLALKKLMD